MCTALTAVCKLISPDLINAVLPGVNALLSHPKEIVRKKAVMALHRFQQLDPDHDGALSGIDFDRHFRQALCDKVSPACSMYTLACPAGDTSGVLSSRVAGSYMLVAFRAEHFTNACDLHLTDANICSQLADAFEVFALGGGYNILKQVWHFLLDIPLV